MRRLFLAAMVLVLLLPGCGRREYANSTELRWIPDPSKCPTGHDGLKKMPIKMGLSLITEVTKAQIKNLEFWPESGCMRSGDKSYLVCSQCLYRFSKEWDCWRRESRVLSDFGVPLNPFLSKFPVPKKIEEGSNGPFYIQTLERDGVLGVEMLEYRTTDRDVAEKVRAFCEGKPFSSKEGDGKLHKPREFCEFENNGLRHRVDIEHLPAPHGVRVTASVQRTLEAILASRNK